MSTRDSVTKVDWGKYLKVSWDRYFVDLMVWVLAIMIATVIRYDGMAETIPWASVGWVMFAAGAMQFFVGYVLFIYRGRYQYGAFEAMPIVALTAVVVTGMLWVLTLVAAKPLGLSRSLVLIAGPIALLFMFGARYLARRLKERTQVPPSTSDPTIIYGAGYVGSSLARRLATDTNSKWRPVALLDDDPDKANLRLHGVPVRGTLADLGRVAEQTGANHLIVAIGDAPANKLQEIQNLSFPRGIKVIVTPPVEEMLREGVEPTSLRDLSIEDLLGRPQVDTNVSQIASYLNGKRVLVTGAGGSIGSQLCVEINKHGPAELIMLDRDETGLQDVEMSVTGNGLLTSSGVVLADIRDVHKLRKIFAERKPQVVFHAAALKHLPMLEAYPDEAWKTNVLGTRNVLEAAESIGVETFINISTDKAANPISILGLSKRMAERLTSGFGAENGKRYLSVRFGNVIGSRGSMLPTFQRLIEEEKPLTVTHPDVTRYFMTIPEACQLVLQAGGIGRKGEVLILDMGQPVRILDIAQQMISLSGKNIEIVYTGLREGEKLDEVLHSDHEVKENPFHPKVSHAKVAGIAAVDLDYGDWVRMVAVEPKERPHAVRQVGKQQSGAENESAHASSNVDTKPANQAHLDQHVNQFFG